MIILYDKPTRTLRLDRISVVWWSKSRESYHVSCMDSMVGVRYDVWIRMVHVWNVYQDHDVV